MMLWLTMIGAGLVTFAIRYAFIGTAGRFTAPTWFVRMLRYVPVAALSALVWPDLLIAGNGFSMTEPRLAAGLAAAAIAWKTRNILATIVCGMLALWLAQWLAGSP